MHCDLSSHCRVCGVKQRKRKGKVKAERVYDCASNAFNLQRVFGIAIDMTDDMQMGVPKTFCRPCYLSMERAVKAIEGNVASRCMVKVYDWSKHAAENCKVNIIKIIIRYALYIYM